MNVVKQDPKSMPPLFVAFLSLSFLARGERILSPAFSCVHSLSLFPQAFVSKRREGESLVIVGVACSLSLPHVSCRPFLYVRAFVRPSVVNPFYDEILLFFPVAAITLLLLLPRWQQQ